MPDLVIRDVPKPDLDALLARAERHGRSLEQETLHLLHEAAAEQMLLMELERATHASRRIDEQREHIPLPKQRPARGPRRRVKYEPTPGRG
jgi:plasmid stability protein